ncbi:hypothetical protein ACU5AX_09295 [Sphingomonas sp. XXL09]|uniref:hypothetical protein n=1 Tax=Sphingomonas sp. XXL09 TaxID=3457787 RepID=UPI00406BD72C
MIHPAIPVSLLALAAPAVAAVGDDLGGLQLAQVTIHERIVIRVGPSAPPPRAVTVTPNRWKEKKGPKCIAIADLGGALVSGAGMLDLALTGNRRIRAKLGDDCRPMDFYARFYLKPAADGQVCAGRDVLSMRSGLTCEIKAFRKLVAVR